MGLYELSVFVHVAAAVALLSGSVIASPGVRAAVRRARTTQEMRAYLAIGRPLLMLEPASALVVLASGVYLASVANFWAQGWVQVSVAFWLVNSVVAGTVVKPTISRVAAKAATAADGPLAQHLDALRWSPRWSFGGDLITANDVAMLYVMTMKPGLAGSLLVVAATIIFVAAARAIGHAFRAPVMSQNLDEPGGHVALRKDRALRRQGGQAITEVRLPHSKRIAGLVGPTIVAMIVSEFPLVQPHLYDAQIAPVVYLSGVLMFVAGLAIARAHNRWARDWTVLVTLSGWFFLGLGLFRMFATDAYQRGSANTRTTVFMVLESVLLVCGLVMTFKAYRPDRA